MSVASPLNPRQPPSPSPSVRPAAVSDDGVVWRVDHGGEVDGGEVAVHQVKLIRAHHGRQDGLQLHVRKVFTDAAMATCKQWTWLALFMLILRAWWPARR